jgi:hypothetical protein
MKKRKKESIFIPNQAEKNPAGLWKMFSCNKEDNDQRNINEERRKKHALKSK